MVTDVGGNRLRWCTHRAGVKPEFTFEERVLKIIEDLVSVAPFVLDVQQAAEVLAKKQGPGPLLPICPEFRAVPVGRIVYLSHEERRAMRPTVKKQVAAAIRKEERQKARVSGS